MSPHGGPERTTGGEARVSSPEAESTHPPPRCAARQRGSVPRARRRVALPTIAPRPAVHTTRRPAAAYLVMTRARDSAPLRAASRQTPRGRRSPPSPRGARAATQAHPVKRPPLAVGVRDDPTRRGPRSQSGWTTITVGHPDRRTPGLIPVPCRTDSGARRDGIRAAAWVGHAETGTGRGGPQRPPRQDDVRQRYGGSPR